jgi:hypothetical protein
VGGSNVQAEYWQARVLAQYGVESSRWMIAPTYELVAGVYTWGAWRGRVARRASGNAQAFPTTPRQ